MARILYIDHYVGSLRHGMEFRPYYLAREWQKLGHEVTLLGASYSHLRHHNPPGGADWTEEVVDGVRFVWLATPRYSGNGLGRVRNILSFVWRLRAAEKRLSGESPDVVIASSTHPFDIYSSRRIARRAGARLIFELHDLWPLSPMELGGMSRWHPFIMVTQLAEDYVCRHVDAVVSLLPKACDHLVSRGLAPEKFHYVPNGVDLDEWNARGAVPMPPAHAEALARLRAQGRFIVMYAGSQGVPNNLGLALDAAALLRDEAACFVLVGQGSEKSALEARVAAERLDNVVMLPSVPKAAVPEVLDSADALLLSLAPQPLFRFGISPNKLMDYMMASKPVIAAIRAGNNLVEEHGCGITVAPDDPHSLADGVRALMRLSAAEREALGDNGRRAVEQCYAYDVLARKFEQQFFDPTR